jgi:hypothetical protein
MVDHDHNRFKAQRGRKVRNQVHGDFLEEVGGQQDQGGQEGGGMGVYLVHLANSTTCNEAPDEGIKAQPPEVMLDEVLCVEDSAMSPSHRLMEEGHDLPPHVLQNVQTPLEIQLFILEKPVLLMGVGKEIQ